MMITMMYGYGFQRQWNSGYQPPSDLIGYKIILSVANGFLYIIPPFSFLRLMNIVNRLQIKFQTKDPEFYPRCYDEIIFTNKNIL